MSNEPQIAEVPIRAVSEFSLTFAFRSSAKLIKFVQGIEKSLLDLETEAPEVAPVEESSAGSKAAAPPIPFNSNIPEPPADFTPDKENVRYAVAKEFVKRVKNSAHNGKTPTLLNILIRWIQLGGAAKQSDLAAAAGLEKNTSFRGAASVLQRHMNAAGGPPSTYYLEMLKFPTAWYHRTDPTDGSAVLTLEPDFFLYLHHRLHLQD
jgi:hypothetical protein